MHPTLATLTRNLLSQLHHAFLSHGRDDALESALCAYVDYWREGGADAAQIVDVTRSLIDSVRAEHQTSSGMESAIYDAMTSTILERCVTLSRQ